MPDDVSSPLLSLVKEQDLIDELQYGEVAAEFKRSGKSVFQILQDFGIMDSDNILDVIGNHLSAEVVKIRENEISPQVLQVVPAKTARMYGALPVALHNSTVQIAMVDPLNPARIDELGFVVKKEIQLVVADPVSIQKAIEKFYPESTGEDESFSELLKEIGADKELAKEATTAGEDVNAMTDLANQAPIVRFVNLVLFQAVQDRASDIHFEPEERMMRVRTRVDGVLFQDVLIPKAMQSAVTTRMKILADLDLADTNVPQDGRASILVGGRHVNLRVSSLPTSYGENIVARILDPSAQILTLPTLGFTPDVQEGFHRIDAVLFDILAHLRGVVRHRIHHFAICLREPDVVLEEIAVAVNVGHDDLLIDGKISFEQIRVTRIVIDHHLVDLVQSIGVALVQAVVLHAEGLVRIAVRKTAIRRHHVHFVEIQGLENRFVEVEAVAAGIAFDFAMRAFQFGRQRLAGRQGQHGYFPFPRKSLMDW